MTGATGTALQARTSPSPPDAAPPLRAGRSLNTLGLRARVTLALAVVALVLSALLGGVVWVTVSGFLISKRTQAVVAQTGANAEQVRRGLSSSGVSTAQLLAQLPREIGSNSLLLVDDTWSTTSLRVNRDVLPAGLTSAVLAGQPAHQRIDTGRGPRVVVGLPLAEEGSAYFEIFTLDELDQTLRTLSTTLWVVMLAAPLGALVLGRWALQPAFRPLDRVALAALAFASGDLTARLDPRGDPGLLAIAETFNATAEKLESRVRADAKFAADVSHELRSPLTTMVTAVDLFESSRSRLDPGGQEALDLLRSEVGRFEHLVNDLLEISRADAGSADVVLDVVALPELVRLALPPRLLDRLVLSPSAEVRVEVDKRRLERAISNLVDNAERHGGGLSAVGVASHDGWAEITVEDRGPGIDSAERERIFDRFARGRRTGRDSGEGAGLGLSLVARHVGLLGGRVSVENVAGGGARFVVALPTYEGQR
ncbi:HAMP domain-containing sensor histidine kinase [Microlunatus lacustris]